MDFPSEILFTKTTVADIVYRKLLILNVNYTSRSKNWQVTVLDKILAPYPL